MDPPGRIRSIALIALAQVLVLSLWFSATAAVPTLSRAAELSGWQQSLFTSAVQLGFVIGSLMSAFLGLADRIEPRRLLSAAALVGAGANAAVALLDPASVLVPPLRLITGMTLAGVYPVGMKLAASWARTGAKPGTGPETGTSGRQDMGLLVGLLVGALTLGSASPHLVNALGGSDWRATLLWASAAAVVGAGLIHFAGVGPRFAKGAPFDRRLIRHAWENRAIRLAFLGYLGHMWELYAVWAWIGAFLLASFTAGLLPEAAARWASIATFLMIASGLAGSLVAGLLADRIGRTSVTAGAMAISGACCLLVGLAFDGPLWLLGILLAVWGVTIVADSAQFSSAVAELSEAGMVGTMLTLQTALGFLLTLVTIHLMPTFVAWLGWRLAFVPLAIGPVLGVVAMLRLRAHPEAARMAGGRR